VLADALVGCSAAESLLLKNGGDPVTAFEEALVLFNSSSIYVTAMAAHHKNTSAVSTVSNLTSWNPVQIQR
jgi:hypothetical protein